MIVLPPGAIGVHGHHVQKLVVQEVPDPRPDFVKDQNMFMMNSELVQAMTKESLIAVQTCQNVSETLPRSLL